MYQLITGFLNFIRAKKCYKLFDMIIIVTIFPINNEKKLLFFYNMLYYEYEKHCESK